MESSCALAGASVHLAQGLLPRTAENPRKHDLFTRPVSIISLPRELLWHSLGHIAHVNHSGIYPFSINESEEGCRGQTE